MSKKESSVSKREYTEEYKLEAARLAEELGGHQAARRLGIPQSTVTNWLRRSRAGTLGVQGENKSARARPITELEAENSRLRRELASAKLDNEILRKATVYFAKESR